MLQEPDYRLDVFQERNYKICVISSKIKGTDPLHSHFSGEKNNNFIPCIIQMTTFKFLILPEINYDKHVYIVLNSINFLLECR